MAAFLRDIKAALDACVLAAANAVCRPIGMLFEPETHQMPLLTSPSEFDSLHAQRRLRGLRPDQLRTLRLLQPFIATDPANNAIARNMAHLAAGLRMLRINEATDRQLPMFTAWVSKADPEPALRGNHGIDETEIDPAGPLHRPKRLAKFTLDRNSSSARLDCIPNVSFDAILNTDPWPIDPDDNFAHRAHGLVVITRHLIEGLERSVQRPYRTDLLRNLDRNTPEEKTNTWLPVTFDNAEQEAAVRAAIAESDRNMATYLNNDGVLVYMRLSANDGVLGREIAPAQDLLDDSQDGTAVERAVRAAAGRWGLRDLVLRPKVYAKGNAIRELGDGTILAGPRGISLQVKTRGVAKDSSERAATWMLKNAAHGLRQARGTIRTALLDPTVELTNLRGRTVTVRGRAVAWIPVVVIDHPDPPAAGVIPANDPKGPSVVLMRRDWEFLWDQLRSATAVVDYIHRVAQEEPLELGAETNRYLDLADKDAQSPPRPLPNWTQKADATWVDLPLLPRDPAAAPDLLGHTIFQQVLEDIANTDFTGDEADRITLLSRIDRVPVASRAELGRLLLRRLTQCAEAAPGGDRMDHRIMYLDHASLQLTFTTMSQLTDHHREIYKSWLLVRRQDFLRQSGALGPIYPWTVGVLLSPRPDGPRPWDTTTLATNGPPAYNAGEHAELTETFRPNC